MKVLDAGHYYEVQSYDLPDAPPTSDPGTWGQQPILFMKREGEAYPGNVGHNAGTNCQELLRVLIDRVKYLDKQQTCMENQHVLFHLRMALIDFEERAARRHGFRQGIAMGTIGDRLPEDVPTCKTCGHIICRGHKDAVGKD